jgi:hypothetical protein
VIIIVLSNSCDNHCSIEFDALGFSVKDPWTRCVIFRCNSGGDLYTIPSTSSSTAASCGLTITSTLWHHRLSHSADSVVASLRNMPVITCNKAARSLCHAFHLGKHTCLSFASLVSITSSDENGRKRAEKPLSHFHFYIFSGKPLSHFHFYIFSGRGPESGKNGIKNG